jgi:NAD-dependent deacetylase
MSDKASLPASLKERFAAIGAGDGRLVVMTGAGISAESGIPTFRGKEGYWTVGSREYHPQEMATFAMFSRKPEEVWAWYLYRRSVCRAAQPNAGHRAVVALEESLQQRFALVTQNVDGLHLRAGNSLERTYQIHGNIDYARCVEPAGKPFALPADLPAKEKGEPLTTQERRLLRDESPCKGWCRPHVLWFDECYDDVNFHFTASLSAAASADVLLVVGTSGATNLPLQVGLTAVRRGAVLVDVNLDPNPFSELAVESGSGFFLQGAGEAFLPLIADLVCG